MGECWAGCVEIWDGHLPASFNSHLCQKFTPRNPQPDHVPVYALLFDGFAVGTCSLNWLVKSLFFADVWHPSGGFHRVWVYCSGLGVKHAYQGQHRCYEASCASHPCSGQKVSSRCFSSGHESRLSVRCCHSSWRQVEHHIAQLFSASTTLSHCSYCL